MTEPPKSPAPDEWDARAAPERNPPALAAVARAFLEARGDHALGLSPTRLLSGPAADAWVLFWCAARRVDDDVEGGRVSVAQWRDRLAAPQAHGLAGAALAAFLDLAPTLAPGLDARQVLDLGLQGLAEEARFDRPRPMAAYLDLIRKKSGPAMLILDALLFPDADPNARARHAHLWAASTQLGDDCRDALRDLSRGRCFVTKEEAEARGGDVPFLPEVVRAPAFASARTAMCAWLLTRADRVAAQDFPSPESRSRAARLSGWWWHALRTGQIRPEAGPLDIPDPAPTPSWRPPPLPAPLSRVLASAFPDASKRR